MAYDKRLNRELYILRLLCSLKTAMLCSSARALARRNRTVAAISDYRFLQRQFSPISKQPLVASSRISSFFLSIGTGFSCSSSSHTKVFSLRSHRTMASQSTPTSIYEFTVKDARGKNVNLGQYKGKVLLIVNVASQCGLTNTNYTELSEIYAKYKNQGLEILAFPCNQFNSQEPGSNEEIVEFACTRFKAEFPIFDKVDVNGDTAAPIYKFLKSSKGGIFGDGIKWNFAKFLVNKEGEVVDRYAPTTSPHSIEKDIKKLLVVA